MIAIMMMIAIIISVAAHLERHLLEPKRIPHSCLHDSVTSRAPSSLATGRRPD